MSPVPADSPTPLTLVEGATDSADRSISALKMLRFFGDYELIEEIGHGGMGVVFKARQVTLNRLVALKLISGGVLASPALVKRFKLEAEVVAGLSHPNIVPLFETGEIDGQHFFSMGLIEGLNLAERVRGRSRREEALTSAGQSEPPHVGAYGVKEAALLLVKVARAVHFAHQRGVLHRDLKPSNILLDKDGAPHLTDFGLAKFIEKDLTLTHTSAVMGTPAYMSPEQARGDTKAVTTSADVYGLGAVFYETLTGTPPFGGGATLETIRQVLDQDPRRPSILNPAVDRDLETICLKCLEKEPARRYGSAEALADELERWLQHEPILARPSTVITRVQKWVRRKPAVAGLIVAVHVAFVVGLAGVLWDAASGRELLNLKGLAQTIVSVAFSPDGTRVLAGSLGMSKFWETARGHELLTIKGHLGPVFYSAFSPDGQEVITAASGGTVLRWRAATRAQVAAWEADDKAAERGSAAPNPEGD